MDQILWEEWNHPDVPASWPASIPWLIFTAVVAFVLQKILFRDDGAAVKYNVLAPTYPGQGEGRIDGSLTEAETGPEVSLHTEYLHHTLTAFRSGTAKYFLAAQQTAEASDPQYSQRLVRT